MAQTSISGYYRTTKRSVSETDGQSISKRRKLEETTSTNSMQFLQTPAVSQVQVKECKQSVERKGAKKTKATRSKKAPVSRRRKAVNKKATITDLLDVLAKPEKEKDTFVPSTTSSSLPCQPAKAPIGHRGACMLELANQKVSDKCVSPPTPLPRGTARLHAPEEPSVANKLESVKRTIFSDSSKEQTHVSKEEIKKIRKMSAKDLAMPTPIEKKVTIVTSRSAPKLKTFTAFEVQSPTKSSPSKQAAHLRYSHLVQTEREWSLPEKYLLLTDKFRCVDSIVNMFQKRGEVCTFSKLKDAVEQMLRRTFDQSNVGQLLTVYPTALTVRQENHIPGNYDRSGFEKYQLTFESNVHDLGEGSVKECSETREGYKYLCPRALLQRKNKFRNNLVDITQHHHQEYLTRVGLSGVDVTSLRRWHAEFPLDQVPDIAPAALPLPPDTPSATSAHQILAKLSNKTVLKDPLEQTPVAMETITELQMQSSLKGVPASLIQKIKVKEEQRIRREMTRDDETQEKLEIVQRLPLFCRVIKSIFVTEKKKALLLDCVVQKLLDSHGTAISKESVERHLSVLLEVAPGWLQRIAIRKVVYLKLLNQDLEMKVLLEQLGKKEKELSS